ncbi:MAG TPA: sulfatase-like hydrolase/transferase [Planctomycetota bacterium]|nr:sulfatase-like hydrolase/transferase [Planctomycetota bacterium]
MKHTLSVLITAILLAPLAALCGADALKPNVLLIVTDDQGAADAGCYGATDLQTPAIDSIAARGVRFTQFYAAAPVCSPSRAGLLTGRYPLRAGLIGNAASQPNGKGAMPSSQITLAKMFKAAGYTTAHIGKWHLGYTTDTMPNAQGFDYSFGHMGGCIDNYSHFFNWAGPARHDLFRNGVEVQYPGRYFPDLMLEEASQFIEQNRAKPFFVYFALNMPHYPYQGEPKWLEHYKNLPYPRNLYAAFLASCDERVGALLKKVDDLGLRQNTIIVFQSDNGHSTEERAHFGGGSAGAYRGQKFSLFEGGIRLPGMIAWPGHLPEGETRRQVVHACDWMPTLAELCEIKMLNTDIDGRSIVPVIRSINAPSPHDVLHWHVGGSKQPQWAVRQGDWKLIGNVQAAPDPNLAADDKQFFLSNLATDVSEKTNFAAQHPDIVQRLRKLHDDWFAANKLPVAEAPVQDKKGNEE